MADVEFLDEQDGFDMSCIKPVSHADGVDSICICQSLCYMQQELIEAAPRLLNDPSEAVDSGTVGLWVALSDLNFRIPLDSSHLPARCVIFTASILPVDPPDKSLLTNNSITSCLFPQ